MKGQLTDPTTAVIVRAEIACGMMQRYGCKHRKSLKAIRLLEQALTAHAQQRTGFIARLRWNLRSHREQDAVWSQLLKGRP